MDGHSPAWHAAREAKRLRRAALIPEKWKLTAEQLNGVPPTGISQWLDASGWFTPRELEITGKSGTEVVAKLAKKEWTCVEVTEAICHRAAVAHQITNCLTEIMFEDALKRAAELDANPPSPLPPLFGLPISIKDLFDYPGVDSTIGLAAWIGNARQGAAGRSVVVRVLEEQGAIVFAKTNIPQIMMTYESWNPVFGTTLNPHNLALTAGGSSSGEGALVALRGSWIGVGTDLGGSIRIPGMFNGIYSLRPSINRLSRKGGRVVYLGTPGGIYGVQGPMANTIDDLDLYLRAFVSSHQARYDPDVIPLPYSPPAPLKPKLRVGYYHTNGLLLPSPPIARAVKIACEALRAQGHEVVPFEVTESDTLLGVMYALWTSDGHAALKKILKDSGERVDEYIEDPFLKFGNGKFLEDDWANDEAAKRVGIWEQKAGEGKGCTVAQAWELVLQRDAFKHRYLDQLNESGVDAIICPVMALPAVPHRTGRKFMASLTYTMLYSLLDWSAGTVPISNVDAALDAPYPASDKYNAFERMLHSFYAPEKFASAPTGVQVVGRRLDEERTLQVMRVVDAAVKDYKAKGGKGDGYREEALAEFAKAR
ncbi:amidase signature domain-containing protein [Hyaloraphidium curvatum]|nr:amidase signature domain-containing protein [Hyaloraphidium curvatum]